MNKEEDMSNTFVAEVGQKSAIFNKDDEIEDLDDKNEAIFPEVKIDPPSEMPSALEDNNKNESPTTKVVEEDEDEEFLEAKKKKKSKKYKKRNPFVMFLIIIICLALGAGASYYYFEVYTEKDVKEETTKEEEKNVENKESTEEIKPTSLFINDLIRSYDYSSITNAEIFSTLYSKEKTTVKDLDETYLRALAAVKANKNLGTAAFSSEDFQNAVTTLFGKQLTLEDKSISIYNGCTKIEYQDPYYHTTLGDCGGTSSYQLVRKIVKAVNKKDTLEVNVAAGITDGNKIYKSYDTVNGASDELIDSTYTSFDKEKDYTKLNQYKYTFNYDKDNNNYYLVSIELIK